MSDHDALPTITASQRTPLVEQLWEQIEQLREANRRQAERIQQLRDEITILKGQKARPKFKPSGMQASSEAEDDDDADGEGDGGERPPRKRAGSAQRRKTPQLTIPETRKIPPPAPLPAGSRCKGYRDFVVQDLRITPHHIRYRLEVWQTPDGERLLGALPPSLNGRHFGPQLRRYVRYQLPCHPAFAVAQLREWGIDLSAGQIDALLGGANEDFLAEQDPLLVTGLAISRHITVGDSAARHQGRNGYVTQIGTSIW